MPWLNRTNADLLLVFISNILHPYLENDLKPGEYDQSLFGKYAPLAYASRRKLHKLTFVASDCLPHVPFMGINIFTGTPYTFIEQFSLETELALHVHLIAVSTLNKTRKSQELSELMTANGISICDSKPVSKILSWTGFPLHRLRGSDFLRKFFEFDHPQNRHYFLGSTNETLDRLTSEIRTTYPRTKIVGCHAPPFLTKIDLQPILELIDRSKANIVWIGLGSPKQDYVASHLTSQLQIRTVAVGAAFDFVSGEKKEAPKFLQEHGLEWFFRLIREPRRLWKRYLLGNISFLLNLPRSIYLMKKIKRK